MGMDTVLASIAERVFPSRKPAHLVGRCLTWDGLTKAGLQQALSDWRRAGSTPPSLLDLAFLSPNAGICTRMLIGGTLFGRFMDEALDYKVGISSRLAGHLGGVVRAVDNDSTARHPEIVQYAYDHLLTAQPEAFAAARQAFEAEIPAVEVERALRTGACERMHNVLGEACRGYKQTLEDKLSPLTEAGQTSEILDQIFPEEAWRIRDGIRRELLRYRHARVFAAPFEPVNRMLWRLPDDKLTIRRVRYAWRVGRKMGEAERSVIVDIGLSAASEDLLSRIVFPR